ncbi:MAG: DapH/DapD/GlmU-related protein [Methanobacterium sp.]|jgi:acetyltransferase-like isoleucine patch superfamily enzyme
MKMIINRFRGIIRRILFGPSLVIYTSGGFPDGELIGKPAQIGDFSVVLYGGGIKMGKNVKIGYGVKIISVSTITGSNNSKFISDPIDIGDNVEIGSNSVILPGVKIGNNVTIGAGSVVTKDIQSNSLVVGVPAKIIKRKK